MKVRIQVKERIGELGNDEYKILIKLPEANKLLFNRILRGKGVYKDYYLVENN